MQALADAMRAADSTVGAAEAGFQATWLARAAAADAASTRAARSLCPATDNDQAVAALRHNMASLLLAAERADAEGA